MQPVRERLPDERKSVTHKFTLPGAGEEIVEKPGGVFEVKKIDVDGYVVVGFFPDGRIGEIFLTIGKVGGAYKIYDSLMTSISVGLQYGIPLGVFVNKMMYGSFSPSGITTNPMVPTCNSIPDYIAKWLAKRFPQLLWPGQDKQDSVEGSDVDIVGGQEPAV